MQATSSSFKKHQIELKFKEQNGSGRNQVFNLIFINSLLHAALSSNHIIM